jgi:signal transduction histidine kinase
LADTTILTLPVEKSRELILHHFKLTQSLVHVITSRVRDVTALQQQNEKMMALGKLSVGLAHKLNNPAAAIVRGSTLLKKHFQLQPESFKQVIAIKMTAAQVDEVNQQMFDVIQRSPRSALSLMEERKGR